MPKIIRNMRENILASARRHLLEGESTFSMRSIAAECGISVGSIYNCFRDREALTAAVMAEDWHKTAEGIRRAVEKAESFSGGVNDVVREIRQFTGRYDPVWQSYSGKGVYFSMHSDRHMRLVSFLSECLAELFARFGSRRDVPYLRVFAEAVLSCGVHEDITEEELTAFADCFAKETDKK